LTDRSTDLSASIERLERCVEQRPCGWPEELFLFVSRITPLVNVDLLIRDAAGRTLLTWRSDEFYGPGWHIPGGVIRFRETAAERIRIVARRELGAEVDFDASPLLVQESIRPDRRDRGHFVSLLYGCRLTSDPDPQLRCSAGRPRVGQWGWHDTAPDDLLREQQAYARFIG
jgi:ADP-ribose pyrophosphatase YjhB (NUDIX family)